MGRAKKHSSALSYSFPRHAVEAASDTLPKRKPLRACSLLKSAAKALLAMNRRRPRAMRSCQSRTTMSGF